MKFRSLFSLLAVFVLSIGFTAVVRAQGVIVPIICDVRPCRPVPRPRPIPLPNALPVKSIELDTRIDGQVATTHVTQVFRNDTPYTLEGTYFFPIPESASISEFAIWENGKKLVGEVRTREEARRIYDEIVRRQRDPGLLEYAGKDLFQASIFPIPPNSDKKLELTYTQVLKAESGTVSYRYPLGTGRNVWGNQPIRALDDRVGPNRPVQQFGTVSGRIEIKGREALRNIYSPSHQIDVKKRGESAATVSFEAKGNDTDFQLFYGLSSNDFGMSLMTYREAGKDGYFMLQLSPKDELAERTIVNKDVVFVVDTSGSMAENASAGGKTGTKLDKAKNALLFGIQTLREGDRFNVINFAGEEHLMEGGLIAANSDGKRRGEEFVKRLTPNGGTNINDTLRASLRQFDSSDRPKMLVFLTDGLPTVGERNVAKIISNTAEIKVSGLRMFNFGVGYDVNTTLLDKLASENGGTADYVEPSEDLEVKVSNFFAKVSSPVLTDLELDFGGVQTDFLYPRKVSDLFKGTQLSVIGRYRNVNDLKNVVIRLRGKSGKDSRSFEYRNIDFPLRAEENDFLPRLWATRRVGWLIEQVRTNGENKELRDEIVDLGTRYGIVTPYTSYLATDGSERSDVRRQPVPMAKSRILDSTGQSAVMASKDSKSKQEALRTTSDEDGFVVGGVKVVKQAGVKTFYLENGVWVDGEFKETGKLPEVRFKFMSSEYFELLSSDKELAQYLSLGEEVTLVWKGKVYRITK
ncbi:MAG TPA: VIT and VWA domain-containing protein [Pyrinomonadaceae bacterium]|nr:VIT and VWA domain-containing protein [Pyrinomonadaceae bacterium]